MAIDQVQLSVIVCSYNRAQFIEQNLSHLLNQSADYERYEVVFVNNNSTDGTGDIAKEFQKHYGQLNLRYFNETNQGLSHARNRGIVEARAPYVAFIDDDAFANENYVTQCIEFFENHENALAIGGRIWPVYESGSAPNWMNPFMQTLVAAQDFGNQVKPFSKNKFPIGANMAFRKSVFEKVGMFDPDLGRKGDNLEGGEEKDLFKRIRKLNGEVLYCPTVSVEHFIPQFRVRTDYIKRMGIGIGRHERKRIVKAGFYAVAGKVVVELIKWCATIALSIGYLLRLKPSKAIMLLRFRWWVLLGLLKLK